MSELQDIQNKEDIKQLVNAFYSKATVDDVIGHFFTEVSQLDLPSHLPIMYSFWDSILFYGNEYKGNPMGKHVEMSKKSPLQQKHFDRWLSLWKSTVSELFTGVKADEAIAKADQIGKLMAFKVKAE